MDIDYLHKKVEDKMFDFIDRLFLSNRTPISSRTKFYNEITDFVEDEMMSVINDSIMDAEEVAGERDDLEMQLEECSSNLSQLKSEVMDFLDDVDSELTSISSDLKDTEVQDDVDDLQKKILREMKSIDYDY